MDGEQTEQQAALLGPEHPESSTAAPPDQQLPETLAASVCAAQKAVLHPRPSLNPSNIPEQPDFVAAARAALHKHISIRLDYAAFKHRVRAETSEALAAAERCRRGWTSLMPVVPTSALPSWHSVPALEDVEVFAAACAQEVSLRAQEIILQASAGATVPALLAEGTAALSKSAPQPRLSRNSRLHALAAERQGLSHTAGSCKKPSEVLEGAEWGHKRPKSDVVVVSQPYQRSRQPVEKKARIAFGRRADSGKATTLAGKVHAGDTNALAGERRKDTLCSVGHSWGGRVHELSHMRPARSAQCAATTGRTLPVTTTSHMRPEGLAAQPQHWHQGKSSIKIEAAVPSICGSRDVCASCSTYPEGYSQPAIAPTTAHALACAQAMAQVLPAHTTLATAHIADAPRLPMPCIVAAPATAHNALQSALYNSCIPHVPDMATGGVVAGTFLNAPSRPCMEAQQARASQSAVTNEALVAILQGLTAVVRSKGNYKGNYNGDAPGHTNKQPLIAGPGEASATFSEVSRSAAATHNPPTSEQATDNLGVTDNVALFTSHAHSGFSSEHKESANAPFPQALPGIRDVTNTSNLGAVVQEALVCEPGAVPHPEPFPSVPEASNAANPRASIRSSSSSSTFPSLKAFDRQMRTAAVSHLPNSQHEAQSASDFSSEGVCASRQSARCTEAASSACNHTRLNMTLEQGRQSGLIKDLQHSGQCGGIADSTMNSTASAHEHLVEDFVSHNRSGAHARQEATPSAQACKAGPDVCRVLAEVWSAAAYASNGPTAERGPIASEGILNVTEQRFTDQGHEAQARIDGVQGLHGGAKSRANAFKPNLRVSMSGDGQGETLGYQLPASTVLRPAMHTSSERSHACSGKGVQNKALGAERASSHSHDSTSLWSEDGQPPSNHLPLQLTPGKPTRQFLAVHNLSKAQADDSDRAAHVTSFHLLQTALQEEFSNATGRFPTISGGMGFLHEVQRKGSNASMSGSGHPEQQGPCRQATCQEQGDKRTSEGGQIQAKLSRPGPENTDEMGELLQQALLARLTAQKAAQNCSVVEDPGSSLGSGEVAAIHSSAVGRVTGCLSVHESEAAGHKDVVGVGCSSPQDLEAGVSGYGNAPQRLSDGCLGGEGSRSATGAMSVNADTNPGTCVVSTAQTDLGEADGKRGTEQSAKYSSSLKRELRCVSSSADDYELAEAVASVSWRLKQQLKMSFAGMPSTTINVAIVCMEMGRLCFVPA
jgi:hypothetical protein